MKTDFELALLNILVIRVVVIICPCNHYGLSGYVNTRAGFYIQIQSANLIKKYYNEHVKYLCNGSDK
tara:strand:+ start:1770 stop:1970 length:201 start_codon:yes stop_codon:yes gene_type:complete